MLFCLGVGVYVCVVSVWRMLLRCLLQGFVLNYKLFTQGAVAFSLMPLVHSRSFGQVVEDRP